MATQQIKDILDTEIPKPSFVLSPSVAAPLPSEMPFGESGTGTGRSGKDNVARTLDPYSGKFEHVPEDTPRVYGDDQSLLVEAEGRTNHVPYSSDFTQWNKNAAISTSESSIINGKSAALLEGDSGKLEAGAGTYSSSQEVAYVILEKADSKVADEVFFTIREENNFNTVGRLLFNTTTGNVTLENGIEANSRKLTSSGPNGQPVWLAQVRYDPTTNGYGGNSRKALVGPSFFGDTDRVRVHHAQLEEAPNASSPIVTGGSPTTRAEDDYTISVGDWWNTTQGSFLLTGTSRVFAAGNTFGFPSQRWLNHGANTARLHYNNGNLRLFDDSGSNVEVLDATTSFSPVSVGISFTQNEMRLSANGSSNVTNSHDGSWLKKPSGILLGLLAVSVTFQDLSYYPRALPESTLNILTS